MTTTPAMTDQDEIKASFYAWRSANKETTWMSNASDLLAAYQAGRAAALPQQVVAAGSIDTPEFRQMLWSMKEEILSTATWDGPDSHVGRIIAYIDARLPAPVKQEGLEKDAAMYRWLRSQPDDDTKTPRIDVVLWSAGDESCNEGIGLRMSDLDAAIDAAILAKQGAQP